jgi:uncharacterized membrane protein
MVPLWDMIAYFTGTMTWWTVSYWTLVAGLIASIPAGATGFVDLMAIPPGPAQRTALAHLITMVVAVALFVVSWLLRGEILPSDARRSTVLIIDCVGLSCVGIGGWLGGHLVYKHAVGIQHSDQKKDAR